MKGILAWLSPLEGVDPRGIYVEEAEQETIRRNLQVLIGVGIVIIHPVTIVLEIMGSLGQRMLLLQQLQSLRAVALLLLLILPL